MVLQDPSTRDPNLCHLPESLAGGLEIIAARALGDAEDARDVVQETLARALEAIRCGRLPADISLWAFVYGIARHVIADVLRRRAREPGTVGDPAGLPQPGPSALEVVIHAEERVALARALAALSASDREILDLCYVQGERISQIAARLGEPADRLRKRKSRALERLRQRLTPAPADGHKSPSNPIVAT